MVVTADLTAFLVLQMRELSYLAKELGKEEQARRWADAAEETQSALLDQLWTGDRFVARGAATGDTWSSSSLLDLMPIMLGEHLPEDVSSALADHIKAHLTPHGLATELPTSPHYLPDGYWRGPIWAPATVLIEDGLRRAATSASRTTSAPASAPCAKRTASPRTSTPSPERACATAPTPGPPAATSCWPKHTHAGRAAERPPPAGGPAERLARGGDADTAQRVPAVRRVGADGVRGFRVRRPWSSPTARTPG